MKPIGEKRQSQQPKAKIRLAAAPAQAGISKRRFHIVRLEERVTPGNGGGGHETSHGGGLY
jgi:hypothetical protein